MKRELKRHIQYYPKPELVNLPEPLFEFGVSQALLELAERHLIIDRKWMEISADEIRSKDFVMDDISTDKLKELQHLYLNKKI